MYRDEFELVKVTIEDMDLLFEWSNDSECRKNSFNSQKIEYMEHKNWFTNKMNDQNCDMYLCIHNNEKIGQIRLDLKGKTGFIGYSIKKEHRGKGYGIKVLELLENEIKKTNDKKISNLVGKVKLDNLASQKVFDKLGYISQIKEGYILYTKML